MKLARTMFLTLLLLVAVSSMPSASDGLLQIVLGEDQARGAERVTCYLKLTGYNDEPLKALQFKLVSTGCLRLVRVTHGPSLSAVRDWNLSHVIVRGPEASLSDTAKVVLYGNGHHALGSGSYNELLIVECEVRGREVNEGMNRMELTGVVGALANGERARLTIEPESVIRLEGE